VAAGRRPRFVKLPAAQGDGIVSAEKKEEQFRLPILLENSFIVNWPARLVMELFLRIKRNNSFSLPRQSLNTLNATARRRLNGERPY
jgi:hypothetical protein